MSGRKRDRHLFKAVKDLDEEDVIALTKHKASTKRQKQNSLATISQQKIHTKLLEVRILLQRALQGKSGNDETTQHGSSLEECNHLLEKLLSARQLLLHPDEEDDADRKDYAHILQDDQVLEDCLEDEYKVCEKEWETVLNQRHKDVRLHAGLTSKPQFRVLDSSLWEQVQQTVTHEKVMAKSNPKVEKGFDDSKVYQQLLKDFLSASSASSQQSANGTVEQRLRATKKRTVNANVDRRASKGRKLRYTAIPKLVNFTFPLSRPNTASMLDEDAWFKSLFGGATKTET